MKKVLLSVFMMMLAVQSFAQFGETAKQMFESPKMKEEIAKQKIVAILPFTSKITYKKQPKNFSAEENRAQEQKLGMSVQSAMYTYLLRRAKDYSVGFQDIEKTNTLLRKAGILDKLDESTKEEIAKALGVDAVISGRVDQEASRSEAGAIITTALIGGLGSKTGESGITMQINNGADGELLWRYTKRMNESLFTSTDDVIERHMRKVSRNFPYMK